MLRANSHITHATTINAEVIGTRRATRIIHAICRRYASSFAQAAPGAVVVSVVLSGAGSALVLSGVLVAAVSAAAAWSMAEVFRSWDLLVFRSRRGSSDCVNDFMLPAP